MKQSKLGRQASIIGLGNVLLGDDAFGPLTVEAFLAHYECAPGIEILDLGAPGLDLAPYLYTKDVVVIVDAVQADGKPGTLRTYRETDLVSAQAQLRLTDHDAGLEECLMQLRLAGYAPQEVVVLGVIPQSCDFGRSISPALSAAISGAIDRIAQLLCERGFDCRKRPEPLDPKLGWLYDLGPQKAVLGSNEPATVEWEIS